MPPPAPAPLHCTAKAMAMTLSRLCGPRLQVLESKVTKTYHGVVTLIN